MSYPSPAQLLDAVNYERSKRDRSAILPVEYEKSRLAIQVIEIMPANVLRAIELAVNGRSASYHVQAVLGATLTSNGASIRSHLHHSIGGFPITLNVGMVGYINSNLGVLFMSSHFAYGNLSRFSPGDMPRYTERSATDLQINELLAILLAAQPQSHDQSGNAEEILVIIPTPHNETIYYATVTPTKAMVVTSVNYNNPIEKFKMSAFTSIKLTPGNPEIYALVHVFLAKTTQ